MPDAVEQPTVPEEAIEAARRTREFRAGSPFDDAVEDFNRAVLAAAIPVIEKRLRARLADEIDAAAVHEHVGSWHPHAALIFAARIVRGEQP